MKIWLDDQREPPDTSWVVVRCYWPFKQLVQAVWPNIEMISFDHDLGEPIGPTGLTGLNGEESRLLLSAGHNLTGGKTGYDAICVVEMLAYTSEPDERPPANFTMTCHSSNTSGKLRINQAIKKIHEILAEK